MGLQKLHRPGYQSKILLNNELGVDFHFLSFVLSMFCISIFLFYFIKYVLNQRIEKMNEIIEKSEIVDKKVFIIF